jgi:hypothetical protein
MTLLIPTWRGVGRTVLLVISWLAFSAATSFGFGTEPAPVPAISAGYQVQTFDTRFDESTVDLSNSRRPSYRWFRWQFLGRPASNADRLELNRDHSVTLLGDPKEKNGNLATAAPADNDRGFVGVAFGGGAYFEAVIRFNPAAVDLTRGWPAFWSVALEHLIGMKSVHWQGQEHGFRHFVEADIFEYNALSGADRYCGALHSWYGVWNRTCQRGYCDVATSPQESMRVIPKKSDFATYHRYGLLWVPATHDREGFVEYYLDGERLGCRTSWRRFTEEKPNLAVKDKSKMFSVIDQQHLVLVLVTGYEEPMQVRSVKVWQKDEKANLRCCARAAGDG